MNKIFKKCLVAGMIILAAAGLGSCSKKSSEPSALIAQSERISGELSKIAEESPMYLESAGASYADGVLSVDIKYSDPLAAVGDYSQALVEYVVSIWLKGHLGADLDTTLNTLSSEQGSLKITLGGADGTSKEFTISSARLKKLLVLKPSELNFSAVKDNVALLMERRSSLYGEEYKAEDASFSFTTGFAQYTLVFESATQHSNLTQDSLRGRYQKALKDQYENYGACAPVITELLKSLGVEGYRFVYEAKNNESKTLKAALPWRLFE